MFCSLNQLKHEDEEVTEEQRSGIPKEALFEKPLTPSDVGKLNRLVIPKHHALKYFPLTGVDSGEVNGLLLGFEDEVGKSWRFRYSYWSSSQSYVLTKGWSRFVKEKKLDAGDIVLFERHRLDCDRFFIGWRRRDINSAGNSGVSLSDTGVQVGSWSRVLYPAHPYPIQFQESSSLPYQTLQPHCLHNTVLHTQLTTATGKNNSKKLRLFGVNLEFQLGTTDEPPETEHLQQSLQS